MDLTVLELHLHDAEFNAPFASGRSAREGGDVAPTGRAEASDDADDADVTDKLGPLAALAAFVGLALVARYLRGGEAERAAEDEVEA